MSVLAVVLAGTAASYAVGATALVRRGVWVTGVLLAAAALLVGAGLRAEPLAGSTAGALLLSAVVQVVALALICYPLRSFRDPADLVAVVLVGAMLGSLVARSGAAYSPSLGTDRAITTSAAVGVLALHTWWRLERSDEQQRWPLLWMALSAGSAVLWFGVAVFVVPNTVGVVVLCALVALIPLALYVGVTRPQTSDVRGLVGGVVVTATSLITFVALLETLAAAVSLASGRPLAGGGLAALAAVCALAVHPLQTALRAVVDEVLFGRRPDPLRAASQVVDVLGDDPAEALAAVRGALLLPYVAVRAPMVVEESSMGGDPGSVDDVLVSSGDPVASLRSVPMPWPGGRAAELVVGLRPGELRLGAADEQVLRMVAPLLAQTLRARAAVAEQRTSREATIRAVEEERRRLRRDLHDGLGPRLSGIAFTSDAARNTVRTEPSIAEELLDSIRSEATSAMAEIRQLVYGMRPPALDELGLVPALQQHAATLRTPDERRLQVDFAVSDLPALPAAWEVAAYRIVASALDNTARHSGTDAAAVRLTAGAGNLMIEVTDSGGGRSGWKPGVGISSMQERSAELGGTLVAGPARPGPASAAGLPSQPALSEGDAVGWLVRCLVPLPSVQNPHIT